MRGHTGRHRLTALAVTGLLGVTTIACSSDDGADGGATTPITDGTDTTAPTETTPSAPNTVDSTVDTTAESLPAIDLDVRPGVEQLTIVGLEPGEEISVESTSADGNESSGQGTVADANGAVIFRGLDSGVDYIVATGDGQDGPVQAMSRDDHPDASFYTGQTIGEGFGYLETRDGTTLGVNVALPGPADAGPYPTVVEYSGYEPSNPDAGGFKDLFTALGYAYVGVNMRGTGCSGGSFRFFEYAQSLDGYDAVEAVAAQPWVMDNEVGMVGISYPGISQLFVAQTQPPNLVAITPLSVLDDSYRSTLYPGGLLNTGFAVEWTQERMDQAAPEGQEWAAKRIADGDEECAANQELRLQNPDLVAEIRDNPFYSDELGDEIAPATFVDQIQVPTFLAGAWQDEQTGGRFPVMLDRFTGTDHFYASLVNGLHTESIGPGVFPRYVEFLDLYVGKRTPSLAAARGIVPILAGGLYGVDAVELPPDRFEGMTYDDALAQFESEPPIQVLFEEGAADGTAPRTPLPRFVESFDAWPIPTLEPTPWYLGPDGTLVDEAPADNSRAEYLALPDGIPATFYEGDGSALWRTDVVWDWQEPAPGTVAAFLSAPLTETVVMAGSASADLWVSSNLGDTDLEVTVSEVRPDGQEMYVQSGWLRASQRALDEAASSELRPVQTHLEADAEPLPGADGDKGFDLARVEIFPFAHVFRAGSQIRISVDAPGGNRAVWVFETIADGEQVQIALGGDYPSRVVLPVVPGIDVPESYPECGALRGQPCRVYSG